MAGKTQAVASQGAGRGARGDLAQWAVKADEEPWTQADLDEVLAELDESRTRVQTLLEALETQVNGLMRDAGDGAGQDQADVGATSHERDQELLLLARERENLLQIDQALERIDAGTFGVCTECGEPVGKLRAMAFPRAALCIACKQRQERR